MFGWKRWRFLPPTTSALIIKKAFEMGSLRILPVELVLEIVDLLKPQEINAPVVGSNACWTKITTVAKLPIVSDNQGQFEPWTTAIAMKDQGRNVSSALWNLRRTNKEMNQLCLPYLFKTVNLMERDPEPFLHILRSYGQNIRSLRILVDPFIQLTFEVGEHVEIARKQEEYHDAIAQILRSSPNLESIALYYRSPDAKMPVIAQEIAIQMKKGVIRALGIYSILVMQQDIGDWTWNNLNATPSVDLFTPLAANPALTSPLKELDIAITGMSQAVYDAVRTHFTSLETLTIRRGLRLHLGRLWDPEQQDKWQPKLNLTTLHLIDCLSAYAPHIPELVRHYGSLKYLTVSTCGSWEDERPPMRPYGWHTRPDALCAVRKPLDVFHVEHMTTWEIIALGVIPAKRVILSNMTRGDFMRAIRDDQELFPRLETLSIVPSVDGTAPSGVPVIQYQEQHEDTTTLQDLGDFCKNRRVERNFQAYVVKYGGGNYGFA